MDFRLTEEQEMTQEMVRDFAQNEVAPVVMEYDAKTDPQDVRSLGPAQEGVGPRPAHDGHS